MGVNLVSFKCIFSSLPSMRLFGSSLASGSIGTPKLSEFVARAILGWHEAFWELTGFGFHRNSEVKQVRSESNPRIGDPLGSSRVSS
ncbi:hypothetical protein DVH24_002222 [Malus domestica]|uniref:Uncharacterized protein n=1 Tax=Malus domestica TaxID=3750 RepID=A0A498I944_MALDO|nr:hypothetical protein DVH24_002222 [Malus domestica]